MVLNKCNSFEKLEQKTLVPDLQDNLVHLTTSSASAEWKDAAEKGQGTGFVQTIFCFFVCLLTTS